MHKIGLYLMNKKGLIVLRDLIDSGFSENIAFVNSEQDKTVLKDYFDEIGDLCRKSGIDFNNGSSEVNCDHRIAIGWKKMIANSDNLIVLHDSLLPKYRGFNPLVSCLINGEKKIGVTALYASDRYDSGDILFQESLEITYPLKIVRAIELISTLYSKMVLEIFELVKVGQIPPGKAQEESKASYSLWRDEEDYFIDWNKSTDEIRRFVDAVGFPYRGACSKFENQIVRILEIEERPDVLIENRLPGKVIFLEDGKPTVVCGTGLIEIQKACFDESGEDLIPMNRLRIRFE